MNLMNQPTRQTVLRGIVSHAVDRGVSFDEDFRGHMDSNPDRTDFRINVIDGPADLFFEWFETIGGYNIIRYGSNAGFSEIGCSPWNFQEGTVIELGFDQYLAARLDVLTSRAQNEIHVACHQARKRIEAFQ